jgi:hypothetical protein
VLIKVEFEVLNKLLDLLLLNHKNSAASPTSASQPAESALTLTQLDQPVQLTGGTVVEIATTQVTLVHQIS